MKVSHNKLPWVVCAVVVTLASVCDQSTAFMITIGPASSLVKKSILNHASSLRLNEKKDGLDDQIKEKKGKKKKKLIINPDAMSSTSAFSSDGYLEEKRLELEKRMNSIPATSKSNFGVSTRQKRKKVDNSNGNKPLSQKAQKIKRQRTANGSIDSSKQAGITSPLDQAVQIAAVKRGNKEVTLVRGLSSTMDDRKILLKELKKKLGGGGTLVDGVIEIQGSHASKVLQYLHSKGYEKATLKKQ